MIFKVPPQPKPLWESTIVTAAKFDVENSPSMITTPWSEILSPCLAFTSVIHVLVFIRSRKRNPTQKPNPFSRKHKQVQTHPQSELAQVWLALFPRLPRARLFGEATARKLLSKSSQRFLGFQTCHTQVILNSTLNNPPYSVPNQSTTEWKHCSALQVLLC